MFKINFREMKMKKKLMTAFVLLVVMASISGVVGSCMIVAINLRAKDALTDYGFAQGAVGRALVMVTDTRREVRDIVNFQDTEDVERARTQLAETKKKYETFSAEIEPTITTALAKEHWANVQSAVTEYRKVQEDIIAAAANIKTAEERADLNARMVSEFDPVYEKLYAAYSDLMYGKVDAGNSVFTSMRILGFSAIVICIVLTITAVLVGIRLGKSIADSIATPLEECEKRFRLLLEGDFQSPVPVVNTQDEVKDMTDSLAAFVTGMSSIIEDLDRMMDQMAGGNFNITTDVEYPGDLYGIRDALRGFVIKISDTLSKINVSSEEVANSASQISQSAQALAEGATDQASSIEELQATITSISEEVDRNAAGSKEANDMAKNVESVILDSNDQMQKMVEAMDTINESSQQISNIISTINDIASQTNLLALNASIEAARAGEMGKGFAVVANEVGNLASQSAEAAKNSTELIANAISAVENGKGLADVTAEKLGVSASKTQELAATMEDITEASIRQAQSLDQISQGVEQIASVIEENTAMSEESSASSEEMADQAKILEDLVSQFELKK